MKEAFAKLKNESKFFVRDPCIPAGMQLALPTERRASVMNKDKMLLLNEALAKERASQMRCAVADRLKEMTEAQKRHAAARRDRIVYEMVEEIVRAEQHI